MVKILHKTRQTNLPNTTTNPKKPPNPHNLLENIEIEIDEEERSNQPLQTKSQDTYPTTGLAGCGSLHNPLATHKNRRHENTNPCKALWLVC